jgi:hypothetical protein
VKRLTATPGPPSHRPRSFFSLQFLTDRQVTLEIADQNSDELSNLQSKEITEVQVLISRPNLNAAYRIP